MAIVTISRGSYSRGKEVAEETAARLGFECISRDLILEASEEFNLPELKLVRAIHDAPTLLDRFRSDKKKYVAFFESSLLKRLRKDNVVYHGLAGHFFLQGVSHALKVRIIADFEDRVRTEMEREGIEEREARKILNKDDEERRKWSKSLYGIDTHDPGLYDLVIHIKNVTVSDAAEVICHAVGLPRFQTTDFSRQHLADLALAAEVRVKLINWYPGAQVMSRNSNLEVKVEGLADQEDQIRHQVVKLVTGVSGVQHVKINVIHSDG